MTGEYSEELPISGGRLIVTKNSYKINFYFPGPDLRYNGTWLDIQSNRLDSYIKAYKTNWETYIKFKSLKLPGEMKQDGAENMSIYIGGYFDGVCITSYHLPITTEEKLNSVISEFEFAKLRGKEIQEFLKTMK